MKGIVEKGEKDQAISELKSIPRPGPLTIAAAASTTYQPLVLSSPEPLHLPGFSYDTHSVPFDYSFGAAPHAQSESCNERRKIPRSGRKPANLQQPATAQGETSSVPLPSNPQVQVRKPEPSYDVSTQWKKIQAQRGGCVCRVISEAGSKRES